jgi:glutaredoxin-like protein NrdH
MAYAVTKVPGREARKVFLYALSTCIWCRRTKQLLSDLGVGFEYVDVDLLPREEKRTVEEEIQKWNPRGSFPTIVVDGKVSIPGFDETRIREVLGS